jgi:hypothetical protein
MRVTVDKFRKEAMKRKRGQRRGPDEHPDELSSPWRPQGRRRRQDECSGPVLHHDTNGPIGV